MTKTPIRKDLAALALITALVLLFFWRIIAPKIEDRAIFPPGDFTDQFWAFRMYEARAFAAGRLPLWSENFNSGHPFLADVQSALFYPVGLVFTLGVVVLRGAEFTLLGLEIEAILHFILAGAFTYFLARRLLGSRVAALVSAITFTFGGYLTSYPPQQLAMLETATWLPLALLCLDLAVERGVRYYVATGVVLGIAALAGHPQTFLFVVYACGIYFVWRVTGDEWRRGNNASRLAFYALRFAFTLLIAAGIAAAQWIPTLEYQTVSTRAAISWAEAARGFPTIDPLQMILPGFTAAFQSPLYIGVFPLWLAALALLVNRTREKIFWAALALGSLLVAFGFYVFAYALLYLFGPGFGMFRGQERLAFIVSFSLALLAGYGFHDLMQTTLDKVHVRRVWALLPAGVTVSALMLFAFYIAGTQHSSGRLAFLLDRSGLMVLLFVLASVLAAWRISLAHFRGRVEWGSAAIALIVFDLFSINTAAYNAAPNPRYPVTTIVQTIQNDRDIFRVVDEGRMPGHFGIAYRLEEISGISPLRVAHYDALLDLPPEKLWSLLNVRYVITGRPGFANAEAVTQDSKTRLLRLQNSLPRAWLVGAAKVSPDDRATLEAMADNKFDPNAMAYVAEPLPFPPSPNAAFTPVVFEKRAPEHLIISMNTPTDQLLVLSEVYYPGWCATVDGVPAPILRADVALRAVPVRAGAHRVELIFDPWSVKIGIVVSVVTVLAVIVGAVAVGRRKSPR
jgi:hypothetical protein